MRREEREPKFSRGAAFRVERSLAIGRERIEKWAARGTPVAT
jgi:hypothetical protein